MARYAVYIVASLWFNVALTARVSAQACDSIEAKPSLVIVLDTSGSMELKPDCVCSDGSGSCPDCMPSCNANPAEKSRWAVALEALTGSWQSFQCETYPRTDSSFFTYDLGYNTPYHRPWSCTGTETVSCEYPGGQNADGIIDLYGQRLGFGLMTFDSRGTWNGGADQVQDSLFNETYSQAVGGLWSYGAQGSAVSGSLRDRGPNVRDRYVGKLMFPGCPSPYRFDTGVRNATAAAGALVQPLLDGNSLAVNGRNAAIKEALLYTRPYGGTPVAAALDDLFYYQKHDVVDTYASCRKRYALLITDGIPDDDWRTRSGCNCATTEQCCQIATGSPCTDSAYDPSNFQCPYPKPEEVARALVCGYDPTCTSGVINQLFVVGFSLNGPQGETARALLDQMAFNGSKDGASLRNALYANDLPELNARLSTVLNSLAKPPLSRTISTFVSSRGPAIAQYEFVAGYQRNDNGNYTGILERKRTVCNGGQPTKQSLTDTQDRFHLILNSVNHPARDLWTVLPSTGTTQGYLYRGGSGAPCGMDGCDKVAFTTQNITPELLNITSGDTAARRDLVVSWMMGGPPRAAGEKLGSIRHSSPVVEPLPLLDRADQGYNAFRARPEVAGRPIVVYIASNDGVLHAFSAEDYHGLMAGQEIWGFIPPYLLRSLNSGPETPPNFLDGTAVIKDVFFSRRPDQAVDGTNYHTVLAIGLRGSGKGYAALDVTNPLDCANGTGGNCKFLWQFDDADIGTIYGQPALAQVLVEWEGTLMERAVAILPGGGWSPDSGSANGARDSAGSVFKSRSQIDGSADISHRAQIRAWKHTETVTPGRAVYIVDVATGKLLKKIGSTVFPSPVVGTPAVFQGDVGSIATRAFVSDADGVIWRIDLSKTDPDKLDPKDGWTARPFHDMFWHASYNQGSPSNEAPVISVDAQGRVVVIHGSGHMDEGDFDPRTDIHAVVSLTEQGDFSAPNVDVESITAAVNWELRLETSEMVTGPLQLFDKTVLFSSYKKLSETNDSCDCGKSRLYALHYLLPDTGLKNGADPTYEPKRISFGTPYNLAKEATDLKDYIFMGASIRQLPQCIELTPEAEPFLGQMRVPIPTAGSAPAFELSVTSSFGNKNLGESVGSMTYQVPRPASTTTIKSYGASCN